MSLNRLMHAMVLISLMAVLPACQESKGEQSSPASMPTFTQPDQAEQSAGKAALPRQPNYSLSPKAAEVSRLLDRRAHEAAETLLDSYLPANPSDAGLYCQYIRCIIQTRTFAANLGDLTGIPGMHDGCTSFAMCKWLATRAVQFDPDCQPYLADLIIRTVHTQMVDRMEKNNGGFVYANEGEDGRGPFTEAVFTMRLELSKDVAAAWSRAFEQAADTAASRGKAASAFIAGELCGYVRSQDQYDDFREANRFLLQALGNEKADQSSLDKAWLQKIAARYPRFFGDELKAIASGRQIDPNFEAVKQQLKEHGVEIEQ